MCNILKLQEPFISSPGGPALECSAILEKHCLARHLMRLEAGQDIMLHQVQGGDDSLDHNPQAGPRLGAATAAKVSGR